MHSSACFGKVSRFGLKAVCLLPALLAFAGCSPPAGNQASESESGSTIRTGERWEAIYLEDSKIGYQHTTIEKADQPEAELLNIRSVLSLTFYRSGQPTQMTIDITTRERPDGRLVGFNAVQKDGAGRLVTEGEVRDGRLHLNVQRAGQTVRHWIAWKDTWGGLFALDSSLAGHPMKPGETRRLRALVPILFQPADVLLEAKEVEETELLGGKREKLLKIQVTFTIGGNKLEEFRWVDANGESLKTHAPQTKQTSYRTTRSVALRPDASNKVDVAVLSSVPVARRLEKPHDLSRAVYRASVDTGDLKGVFDTGASQTVRMLDNQTAEIVVQAISEKEPARLPFKETQPTDEFVQSNTMIQSDDRTIRRIAATIARDESDPWRIALATERFVNQYITVANFTQAFDTAAEVAANRTGDCTEHAVLLAALCRARKIPARVAIGLVYLPSGQRGVFAYHMWTEVWIKDRWIPLDATLARGGIGAAHIKLTTSSLTGASPQSVFLPVAHVVGRLKLEVVEAE